ncbi:MAG TPA: methyltransferase domain-containing protein [Solirubrobacteraceae bacterium]
MDPSEPPHSAAYLGAERDFWWNEDYLELLARRFDFAGVASVLDVGAGIGHWGMLLASVLPREAFIVGLERDPRWVQAADRRRERREDSSRFRFDQGVAEALPYEAGTFDLVTCQTLLMHVPDPEAVIAEMVRVTRPGGLVLASEPNNAAGFVVESNLSARASVEARTEAIRFILVCERGKMLLGKGSNRIGDLVPGYFAAAGLTRVKAYMNDRAAMMVEPYDDAGQAFASMLAGFSSQGCWCWPREEAHEYFVAGRGTRGGVRADLEAPARSAARRGELDGDRRAAQRGREHPLHRRRSATEPRSLTVRRRAVLSAPRATGAQRERDAQGHRHAQSSQ